MNKYLLLVLLVVSGAVSADPRIRPANWGDSVIETKLDNLYLVDKGIYRSEQPEHENVNNLKSLGIKEVLNLREYHSDEDDLENANFIFHRIKMNTGNISEKQLIAALQIMKNRKGPILIHCWHGSDRTGVTIATYRIVFNNWSKAQAIDEMVNGGYGYHSNIYPELVSLLQNLNIPKIKKELGLIKT